LPAAAEADAARLYGAGDGAPEDARDRGVGGPGADERREDECADHAVSRHGQRVGCTPTYAMHWLQGTQGDASSSPAASRATRSGCRMSARPSATNSNPSSIAWAIVSSRVTPPRSINGSASAARNRRAA